MARLTLLCVCLLLGAHTTAVAEPISAIVSAAASGIIAGSSLAGTTMTGLMNNGYSVTCGIEVENWTRFALLYPEVRIAGGALSVPPRPILPSKREAMVARKTGHTATGSYGTVSWLVQGKRRRVFVMWSAPYDFTYHSNWLGVGISRSGYLIHPPEDTTFNQMYYGNPNSILGFQRLEFWSSTTPVLYRDADIEITGTMSDTHRAQVHIIVRPIRNEDLTPSILALLRQGD